MDNPKPLILDEQEMMDLERQVSEIQNESLALFFTKNISSLHYAIEEIISTNPENKQAQLLKENISRILGARMLLSSIVSEAETDAALSQDPNYVSRKADTAIRHLAPAIKELLPPGVVVNAVGMKMKLILPGTFIMGSGKGPIREKPVHKVTINKPFYLGVHPVTQQQYECVMSKNPSHFKGRNLPVDSLSWDEVQEFIKALSEMENTPYRLPTEAEWEYACRAKSTTEYYWGDDPDSDYLWHNDNSGGASHEVGSRKPNAFGLFDMSGNVWEWCQDPWHANYLGAPADGRCWESEDNSSRVIRGGCWLSYVSYSRSASRCGSTAANRGNDVGFRVALTLL